MLQHHREAEQCLTSILNISVNDRRMKRQYFLLQFNHSNVGCCMQTGIQSHSDAINTVKQRGTNLPDVSN